MLYTFGAVFLAELGDKTQLATFCLAAEGNAKWSIFIGSAAALVLTSLIAVLLGCEIAKYIPTRYIKIGAGSLFVILGIWMMAFSSD